MIAKHCSSPKRNTFEVLIATEMKQELTRVLFYYEGMEWIKEVPPTVGYSDGDCRGQVGFRPDPTTPEELTGQIRLFIVTDPLIGQRCDGKHL